jgi:hypothetical protein
MKKLAVIGSGPAGMFAGWAGIWSGWHVTFHTPAWVKAKSSSAGVFFLHHDLGLPLRSAKVDVRYFGGEPEDYRRKIYGEADVVSSLEKIWDDDDETYWDGAQAIDMVWDIMETARQSGAVEVVDHAANADFVKLAKFTYDAVVNTAPLNALLDIALPYRDAWVHVGAAPPDESYMLYNAHPGMPWYRAAAAFGRFTLEYNEKPPEPRTVFPVRKVMPITPAQRAEIEAEFEGVLLTGRFGAWDKSKLSHHAFNDTADLLEKLDE